MKLIKIETGEYPVSDRQFRERSPNVSFPPSPEYAAYGYAVVKSTPQPERTEYQVNKELPPKDIGGEYYEQWVTVDLKDDLSESEYAAFVKRIEERDRENEQSAAKRMLEELDFKSIRDMREYIASRPDAPESLKWREEEAKVQRAKVRAATK